MLVHMTTLLSACKEIEGSCGLLLLFSLAFAFVLPSFSLIPWLFSLRPSSRRLSRDELTSFPLPAPCRLSLALVLSLGCPTAAFGGATAALTPAEFAGSRRCRLPAP